MDNVTNWMSISKLEDNTIWIIYGGAVAKLTPCLGSHEIANDGKIWTVEWTVKSHITTIDAWKPDKLLSIDGSIYHIPTVIVSKRDHLRKLMLNQGTINQSWTVYILLAMFMLLSIWQSFRYSSLHSSSLKWCGGAPNF